MFSFLPQAPCAVRADNKLIKRPAPRSVLTLRRPGFPEDDGLEVPSF